ncbi:hypothetical protein CDL12_27908 [Handroanthus impetiginosus]|uniref:Uncharacterized protein n=1 Tax=Handroanthus impetiginosus TaxID=429701 RepID=A0A2G9G2S6_9LAMI|nr:hypothetical protein CDL12_27908 [Handroanthus impetiginosus]
MNLDYYPSGKSVIKSKWVATAASIWIQCTSGSIYTFSIYSPILKTTQGYDQSTLDTISVFKDIGANAGLLSGILYSATAAAPRGGPWVVLLAGAIQCFVGYFLTWLTVTGALPRPPAAIMCFYMLLAAHATTFFNTANVVTGVHNFSSYRGTIVGIMKGFLGLSGAILIQVYLAFFKNNPSSYLLLLALLPTINTLLLMGFVRIYKTNEEDEEKHLNSFSYLAVTTAAYLTAVIVIQNVFELKLSVRVFTFALLILLLVFPIFVAMAAQRDKSYWLVKPLLEHKQVSDEKDQPDEDVMTIRQEHGEYHKVLNGPEQVSKTTNENLQNRDNLNLVQAIVSFLCLFYTTGCAMGSGLATVNNLGQIGESLGYTTLQIHSIVSMWSIWDFLGRFTAGYPRSAFIAFTLAAMCFGQGIIASGFPGALYAGSILVALCYGSQWSLMPTIASEIFGEAHLGTIFNAIMIASPVGSYIFSVKIFGYYYDKEAYEYGNTCIGKQCSMSLFVTMAGLSIVGFYVALVLFICTADFYARVIIPRALRSVRRSRVTDDVE